MRVSPRVFALLVGLWGLGLVLLGRHGQGGCPLGSCPACGLCFQPPPSNQTSSSVRVG